MPRRFTELIKLGWTGYGLLIEVEGSNPSLEFELGNYQNPKCPQYVAPKVQDLGAYLETSLDKRLAQNTL